jgi:hypothetical protein
MTKTIQTTTEPVASLGHRLCIAGSKSPESTTGHYVY